MKPSIEVMFQPVCKRIAHALAWGIRFVHVNQVRSDRSQTSSITKTRSILNWLPVTIGNLVFRFRVPAIRVLPTKEWISWESAVAQALGKSNECLKSGIRVEELPGEPLASLLKQAQYSEQQKRCWVELACRELAEFHQLQVELAPFGLVGLSHADASVSNVMIVAADTGQSSDQNKVQHAGLSATWFDFDLRHDFRFSSVERQADDLRALIFTAMVCSQWNDLPVLVEGLKQAYPLTQVWSALKQTVVSGQLVCDLFHLAQLRRASSSKAHWRQVESVIKLI